MVGTVVLERLLKDLKIARSLDGFRSSFRSWCSDEGIDREVAEQALVHAVGNQIEHAIRGATCWSSGGRSWRPGGPSWSCRS